MMSKSLRTSILLCTLVILILILVCLRMRGYIASGPMLVAAVVCGLIARLIGRIFDRVTISSPVEQPDRLPNTVTSSSKMDLPSALSTKRRSCILKLEKQSKKRLVPLRNHHLSKITKQQRSKQGEHRNRLLKVPAWKSFATAPSPKGTRLCFGFRNLGCKHWREDSNRIGCYHCGFGSSVIHILDRDHFPQEFLLKQVNKALAWAHRTRRKYDTIDVSGDGSFFNHEEYPKGFHEEFFKRIDAQQHVKRLLVESRPEDIDDDTLRDYLSKLNAKHLEIGIGLESSDDFVKDVCINKGFDNEKFEEALKKIVPYRDQCSVVAYVFFKPAFLTEKEAIDDAVTTVEYLADMSKELGLTIYPKLEPALICEGTLLDLLHFYTSPRKKEYYHAPSYWSIVEVIARCEQKGLAKQLRIGARQDMGIIKKISGIYNKNGTFNQYDFWIYDAVQRYVIGHDVVELLADVKHVLNRDERKSFDEWKETLEIGESAIDELLEKHKDKIAELRGLAPQGVTGRMRARLRERDDFMDALFNVLNVIELEEGAKEFATKVRHSSANYEDKKTQIGSFIDKAFEKNMPEPNWDVDIVSWRFEEARQVILRVNFDVTYLGESKAMKDKAEYSRNIWVGIPTTDRTPLYNRLWQRIRY